MSEHKQRDVVEAVLPIDFFSVKKSPRGNKFQMRSLAFFVHFFTLGTFVLVAYTSSLEVKITTTIETEDLTGKGWDKCGMVSKVTDSYTDSGSVSASFDLINVMESKTQVI
jgi:hypothetical protein